MLNLVYNLASRLLAMLYKDKFSYNLNDFDHMDFIRKMKKQKKGLMSKKQYIEIAKMLKRVAPCNLLVFGLGEDSYLWSQINKGGQTYFLEDSLDWINKINDGSLQVKHVKYTTKIEEHREIGFDNKKLDIVLPEEVSNLQYDFVIVDAPLGHQPPRPFKGPGRMSSIYTASKLLKPGGIAIIDDMGRPIEKEYAFHYFGKHNLVKLIQKKVAIFEAEKIAR